MDGAQISGFRDGMESSDCRMSAQGSWLGDGIAMTQISLHALKLKELDTHTKANFTVYNFFKKYKLKFPPTLQGQRIRECV